MNILVGCYWAFLIVWVFGGLALFAYLKWETLTRKRRAAVKRSKELWTAGKLNAWNGAKLTGQVLLIMSPMLIPIAVTALSLYFSH